MKILVQSALAANYLEINKQTQKNAASKPFQREASLDSGLSSLHAPQSIRLFDNTDSTAASYGVQLSKNIREVRVDVQNSAYGFGFALLKVLAGSHPPSDHHGLFPWNLWVDTAEPGLSLAGVHTEAKCRNLREHHPSLVSSEPSVRKRPLIIS